MSSTGKIVLVFGAGLCPGPGIRYLSDHGIRVIVASRTLAKAQEICKGLANAEPKEVDIETDKGKQIADELVATVDGVISFLPYIFHLTVANIAMKHKKHFFTTSYTTAEMRQLDDYAKKNNLIIINECGVDPGTDHMSAMRVIDQVHANGGKISSFTSFCGGLPAPQNNNNPYGYKFSWAPRGVLLASRNDATFLENGKDVHIPGKDLFDNFRMMQTPIGEFEGYPNRNSNQYIDILRIPETKTIIRGTFRYPGWCQTIKKLADIGYLDLTEQDLEGKTYADILKQKLNVTDASQLKQKFADHFSLPIDHKIISNLEWTELFSTTRKVPSGTKTPLDALCAVLLEKLVYKPDELDMILMRHEFVAEYPDRTEHLSSSLVNYGLKNGDSAMSRTVSLPVAIAVRLVMEGKIKLTGLQIPTVAELYNPILDELETFGIKFEEKVEQTIRKN